MSNGAAIQAIRHDRNIGAQAQYLESGDLLPRKGDLNHISAAEHWTEPSGAGST